MTTAIGVDEIRKWFPDATYYAYHADRLAYSFSQLPELPPGFRCLSVGSWGLEAPFLLRRLGASSVTCIRDSGDGSPLREIVRMKSPEDSSDCEVEVYALNAETEEFPPVLADFDLVLMWEVLEHLCHDPSFMVWQAIRAAKIGGIVSITTPNALWHTYTVGQMFGSNALGLKLQLAFPFATHWRIYSPAEVAEMVARMGCAPLKVTSFLKTEPHSLKSRLLLWLLELLRRHSGNGDCSIGQHVYVLARKERDSQIYRPEWLQPSIETYAEWS